MSFTWDWLVVVIAKWCVIEPRLIKALSGFEEPDWAVKVIITVENEGFGELERDSGFARAGWTDEEKGLWEAREKVGGGFHFVGSKERTR